MRKEIYNNKSKMNKIIQQSLHLPVEMCNIIYEYYKLPFLCDVKRNSSWEDIEKELGTELAELAVMFYMNNRLSISSHQLENRFYDNLFGFPARFNHIIAGKVIWNIGLGNRKLTIKNKIIAAKNVVIYGVDYDIIFGNKERDIVVYPNPKWIVNPEVIQNIKKRARENGIRVQHNSKMETLINRLMKL